MCCAGFPWAFGLPSTAAAQGNQPMINELRAVTLVPGLEPNVFLPKDQGGGNQGSEKPPAGHQGVLLGGAGWQVDWVG